MPLKSPETAQGATQNPNVDSATNGPESSPQVKCERLGSVSFWTHSSTSTWPSHPCDDERQELRDRNVDLCRELEILGNTLRRETERHAATIRELRKVRAQLEGSQRFGGILRHMDSAVEGERRARCRQCETHACFRCDWATASCSCPLGLDGQIVMVHDCPRHGDVVRWEAGDR